jgi:hypothetical protein
VCAGYFVHVDTRSIGDRVAFSGEDEGAGRTGVAADVAGEVHGGVPPSGDAGAPVGGEDVAVEGERFAEGVEGEVEEDADARMLAARPERADVDRFRYEAGSHPREVCDGVAADGVAEPYGVVDAEGVGPGRELSRVLLGAAGAGVCALA